MAQTILHKTQYSTASAVIFNNWQMCMPLHMVCFRYDINEGHTFPNLKFLVKFQILTNTTLLQTNSSWHLNSKQFHIFWSFCILANLLLNPWLCQDFSVYSYIIHTTGIHSLEDAAQNKCTRWNHNILGVFTFRRVQVSAYSGRKCFVQTSFRDIYDDILSTNTEKTFTI